MNINPTPAGVPTLIRTAEVWIVDTEAVCNPM